MQFLYGYFLRKYSVLATLIYRSRLNYALDPSQLAGLVQQASLRNTALQVTGVLLFDGRQFLQVLEGPSPQSTPFLNVSTETFAMHTSWN
jgi:hypothetical protein